MTAIFSAAYLTGSVRDDPFEPAHPELLMIMKRGTLVIVRECR